VSRWFEQQVEAALDELPPRIAEGLENVAIVVDDQHPEDPDLFGSWEAAPYMPDKITIFEQPLTRAFPDHARLRQEIRITVLHELAHYFGLDEEEIEELGYG
jgi:predicted Zn-dependent protease with MMP-like domain